MASVQTDGAGCKAQLSGRVICHRPGEKSANQFFLGQRVEGAAWLWHSRVETRSIVFPGSEISSIN